MGSIFALIPSHPDHLVRAVQHFLRACVWLRQVFHGIVSRLDFFVLSLFIPVLVKCLYFVEHAASAEVPFAP